MFLILSFLSFCLSSPASDSPVIAKVGNSEVRVDDLKPFLEKLSVKDQLLLSKNPSALNEYVRGLIVQQLVYKEAQAKKWDQQPQVVEALDKMRQQVITQSYLQSIAAPPQDFPAAADLQTAYDQLKKANALQVPKQYHLAQIYIACPKGADKSVEEKAQSKVDAAVKALKSGDFAAVAKSQSDDLASVQRGGDLGFLPEPQIQAEIRAAVDSLSKNGVTYPIRLNDGWHIIKVLEIKDPYIASLDEVKIPLTNELRKKKAQSMSKDYISNILQKNPIILNEIELAKFMEKQ